jgi:phosphatidylglycerol:prolipoprotein diacylglycerol transferase
MHQILFEIPTPWGRVPIFGYGFMLFVSFAVGTWVAARRAKREGINPEHLWDIAIYCFVGGVLGARILSLSIDPFEGGFWEQLVHFFEIWKGGMVFYGGLIGGFLGYGLAWWRIVRKNNLSTFKIADIVAPSLALGVFFGRLGCFLNGCCYGGVADPVQTPWAMPFPSNSPAQRDLVGRGYQTAFGFLLKDGDEQTVERVERFSGAEEAGLRAGDRIVRVGNDPVRSPLELYRALSQWPQGQPLQLTVERTVDGVPKTLGLQFQPPWSFQVHPTQLYNAIDGLLLFLLLTAYYPYHRVDGQVMALFLICYPINRFLMESLRLDNPATWSGLTMSQNISVLTFAAGVGVMVWLVRRGRSRSPEARG